ncbi:MAG: hypothetical protein JWP90_238 [Mycetocola sp.]|jgi:hypothetical protein|nr:hypothetical protein [Mycetocola sp.]
MPVRAEEAAEVDPAAEEGESGLTDGTKRSVVKGGSPDSDIPWNVTATRNHAGRPVEA